MGAKPQNSGLDLVISICPMMSYDFPKGRVQIIFFSKSCNKRYHSTPQVCAKPQNNEDLQVFWKLKSMSYEIWEIWSQEPALSLIEKFCPGRERILEMWPFILIAICSVGCISLTAPASTSLWILAPFSKEPSAPDWEQQCHKMGAWINCLYQCMTSLSHLKMWKMPIVDGSKRVTTV